MDAKTKRFVWRGLTFVQHSDEGTPTWRCVIKHDRVVVKLSVWQFPGVAGTSYSTDNKWQAEFSCNRVSEYDTEDWCTRGKTHLQALAKLPRLVSSRVRAVCKLAAQAREAEALLLRVGVK